MSVGAVAHSGGTSRAQRLSAERAEVFSGCCEGSGRATGAAEERRERAAHPSAASVCEGKGPVGSCCKVGSPPESCRDPRWEAEPINPTGSVLTQRKSGRAPS